MDFSLRVMFQVLGKGFSLLFCPSEKRINQIMSDPIAKDEKLVNKVIYGWISFLIFVIVLLTLLYSQLYIYEREIFDFVLVSLLGVVIFMTLIAAFIGITNMVATRWFGGNNAHHRFLFALGAAIVPFIILGVLPSISLMLIVPFLLLFCKFLSLSYLLEETVFLKGETVLTCVKNKIDPFAYPLP